MSHSLVQDEISLSSFTKDFERYSWGALKADILSGLSVSMLALPQSLAYALVAGLPIITGLYAAIFSSFIAALFGSSRHLIVGTSNAIAILIQGGISNILFTYYRDASEPEKGILALQILTQLMLLVGIIQILAALLKLGRLTHFVSHTVIVAYIAGVALALVINQLFPFLGMNLPENVSSLYERGVYILSHLQTVHWPTALIGVTCFLLLLGLKRIDNKMPSGAIMLAIVAFIAYLFSHIQIYFSENSYPFLDWSKFNALAENIAVVGETGGHDFIPQIDWPYFNPGIMNNLLSVAFAIALLSVMETISVTKSVAASSGQHLSINQEIFGLGIGNFFSAFIGAMPLSGSTSRTTLNYENGAKTRASALFNCIFIYITIMTFGFFIKQIPLAAFSALLIASSANIVNFKQLFLCLKATRSDAFVLILTLIACLFLSLDIAFYIGVAMSITLYLKKAAIPQLVEFTVDSAGILHTMENNHTNERRQIRFIKVEGELFFGAADIFQSTLKSITEDDTTTRIIILQLKNARDVDATACLAIQQLYEYLKNSGRHLIACGITHQIWDVLSDSGMVELIGKNNLFIFDERHPQLSVKKAFARAGELLKVEHEKAIETPNPIPFVAPTQTSLEIKETAFTSLLSHQNPEVKQS